MLSGVTQSSASLLAELFRTLDTDGSSAACPKAELTDATGGATGSSASMDEIFAALDADADGGDQPGSSSSRPSGQFGFGGHVGRARGSGKRSGADRRLAWRPWIPTATASVSEGEFHGFSWKAQTASASAIPT